MESATAIENLKNLVPTTIIGTLISAFFSISLYWLTQKNAKRVRVESEKKTKVEALNKQLDEILKIAITYPYLETKSFCNTWLPEKAEKGDDIEKYQRYNVFCNIVFNYLANLAEYCQYDLECIQSNHVNMKDWVQLHQENWKNPLNNPNENIESYDEKFQQLIKECLGQD